MNIIQKLKVSFQKNPMVWVLSALLAFSIYSHRNTGKEFSDVCERIMVLEEGYFDIESSQNYIATGIDTEAIVTKAQAHERLMKEDSPEGRAYRWWRLNLQQLTDVCGERLSTPDSR